MTFDEISLMFNRAMSHSFTRTKLVFVSLLLALCGVFVVFFRGIALGAGKWVGQSLVFLPIFLSAAILFACGVLLIRFYHDEIKNKELSYAGTLKRSWLEILSGLTFSLPIILVYLLAWICLGFFVLLSEIPTLGPFFNTVLAFCPFLLNLISIGLVALNVLFLFFFTPILALKGFNKMLVAQAFLKRQQVGYFQNLLFIFLGLLPLCVSLVLLLVAIYLTGFYAQPETKVQTILLWFFLMIPFTVILSPVIIFFFNFAAEAHVWTQKKLKTLT